MSLSFLVGGHSVSVVGLALLGVAVGFVAGLFGVGGGFLLTPLLNVIFGIPFPIAVGTGLCLMVGTSVPALLRHQSVKQGELRVDLLMLAGSFLGVDAGTRTLAWLEGLGKAGGGAPGVSVEAIVVQAGYVLVLLSSAGVFWRQSGGAIEPLLYVRNGPFSRWSRPLPIDLPTLPVQRVSALAFAYLGLGMGFLSGLLGIGGGVALMPILVYGFGFSLRQAAGTGILALVASASFGTFLHALRGHVDLRLAAALLVGASLAAQVGAVATRTLPVALLRRLLAAVLIVAAAAVCWNVLRRL